MGLHDKPVRTAEFSDDIRYLVTGSWDHTIKFWDPRQRAVAHTVQQPERVYAMDVVRNRYLLFMHAPVNQIFLLNQPVHCSEHEHNFQTDSGYSRTQSLDLGRAQYGCTRAAQGIITQIPDQMHPCFS